ncbi:fumarate hydratase C-terminal domain-containing protein, partial [Klebsiella pneumoniae]|uniref:fumarate hydratase C-terminal domain-containing protein n=1 Tax=Klebsiella pneumoniae TaxID=573 RepID=UPI003013EF2C
CWAFRRLGVVLDPASGAVTRWLYVDPSRPPLPMLDREGFTPTGREVRLQAPLNEGQVRALNIGDNVLVSGPVFTGRDAVHAHLVKHAAPVDLRG